MADKRTFPSRPALDGSVIWVRLEQIASGARRNAIESKWLALMVVLCASIAGHSVGAVTAIRNPAYLTTIIRAALYAPDMRRTRAGAADQRRRSELESLAQARAESLATAALRVDMALEGANLVLWNWPRAA